MTKILWTDGSAKPNPGPGGWVVVEEKSEGTGNIAAIGNEKRTTSIRMEGTAIIAAMEYAQGEECIIKTDSMFWINVATKWAASWARRDWVKATGEEIANLDIVQRLYYLYRDNPVKLMHVNGHQGIELNEMADFWAKEARKSVFRT